MKSFISKVLFVLTVFAFGCSNPASLSRMTGNLDDDFRTVTASLNSSEFVGLAQEFDSRYGTSLAADVTPVEGDARLAASSSNYPALTDLPVTTNGAVYLAGGGESLASVAVAFASPQNLPGSYVHGAVLEYSRFDPNNLSAPCFQSANLDSSGAGYESVADWQSNVNVCVLNPTSAVSASAIVAGQTYEDYYCQLPKSQKKYGFFKNLVNIFDIVSKEDRYYWYCTKVVWDVYKHAGIDLDSNDPRVDFSKSNLYGLVKNYYSALYFWSPSKAKQETQKFMNNAKSQIVTAEEILLSPYLSKVWEKIRKS